MYKVINVNEIFWLHQIFFSYLVGKSNQINFFLAYSTRVWRIQASLFSSFIQSQPIYSVFDSMFSILRARGKKDLNKLKASPDTINRNESLRENNVRVLDLCRINVHLEHAKNSQWNAMNRVVIQKAKEKRQKKQWKRLKNAIRSL